MISAAEERLGDRAALFDLTGPEGGLCQNSQKSSDWPPSKGCAVRRLTLRFAILKLDFVGRGLIVVAQSALKYSGHLYGVFWYLLCKNRIDANQRGANEGSFGEQKLISRACVGRFRSGEDCMPP